MNKHKKLQFLVPIGLLGFFFLFGKGFSQSVPTPAPPQSEPIFLKNATIHTGSGDVLENAGVLFEEGKIVSLNPENVPAGTKTYDLTGKHVYPGLIAINSQIGLSEIDAVRSTNDFREPGAINPNARAIVGYNTDSRVTPTIRSNGVLLAQIVPKGELFRGTSSIVQLDAWNWEDAAYVMDDAVFLQWPRADLRTGPHAPPAAKQKEKMKKDHELIRKAMTEAMGYWSAKVAGLEQPTDLRWEALVPVFEGKRKLFVQAATAAQIAEVIAFKIEYGLDLVLVDGRDCLQFTDELKRHNIPVVLVKTHRLPGHEDAALDLPFRKPALLAEAGVSFAITMRDFWNLRNLPFQAGEAAAYGLDRETALASVTKNAAEILGVGDRCGTIAVGMDATLIVTEGDLLDMRTSNVVQAFIQGREIDLGNKQKDLYEKYKQSQ